MKDKLRFKLYYYDKEVNNNIRESKVFIRKEAKKEEIYFMEEYIDMIKFTFNSIFGFKSIANALELDKESKEIVLFQKKVNFEKILKLENVVLYFQVNPRNGNDRDFIINKQTYTSSEIIRQSYDSPFVFNNLPKNLPRELGDYRMIIASDIEYRMINDRGFENKKIKYSEDTNYWFDFIFSINKIFKIINTYGELPGYRINSKKIKKIKTFLTKLNKKIK